MASKASEVKEVLCELSDHPGGYLLECVITLKNGKTSKFVKVLRSPSFILNFDTLDDDEPKGGSNAPLPN